MGMTEEERQLAIQYAWQIGNLTHVLTPLGRKLKDEFNASFPEIMHVFNVTRKGTKSTTALTMATELCLQRPGSLVAFVAQVEKAIEEYIQELAKHVFKTCPSDMMPLFNRLEIKFFNGSKIMCAGLGKGTAAGSYNNLRPFSFDMAIIDEAAFTGSLDEIVHGVFMPALLPRNGRLLMMSTPPPTADHPFQRYCDEAKNLKAYSEHTIMESHHSKEVIDKFIEKGGGIDSAFVQREYFCRFVIDKEDLVFGLDFNEAQHVREIPRDGRYGYWNKYTVMDV